MKVRVARQWNDYRIDEVDAPTLRGPHWSDVSGGVGAPAPHPFLYAYVSCDRVPNVGHSGIHGPCPHEIKVCIIKAGSDHAAYAALADVAGPRPKRVDEARETARQILTALSKCLPHEAIVKLDDGRTVIVGARAFPHDRGFRLSRRVKRFHRIVAQEIAEVGYIPAGRYRNAPAYRKSEDVKSQDTSPRGS